MMNHQLTADSSCYPASKSLSASVLKIIGLIIAGLTCLSAQNSAAQQAWPNKTIKIVVGYAPGGPTDVIARSYANKLSAELNQQVIVENRQGAGGSLAASYVAKSTADGYTLLMAEPGSMAVNTALSNQPSYDPIKDFAPIAQVVSLPMVLVASAQLKINSLKELISLSKTKPIAYGTPGNATMQHLSMTEFARINQIQLTHVAYRGGAPAMTDLLGGQISLVMVTIPSVVPYLKSNSTNSAQNSALVPLAVESPTRSAHTPTIPTFAELGFSNFTQDIWQGFVAPAQTPKDIISKLSNQIASISHNSEFQNNINAMGATLAVSNPQDFSKLIQKDVAYWAKLVADNPAVKE
jgi:tripartite-type tricarboxylate transporter receptor subunit TctC